MYVPEPLKNRNDNNMALDEYRKKYMDHFALSKTASLLIDDIGESKTRELLLAADMATNDTIKSEYRQMYMNQFAFRGGYFHEHETKGARKYFTVGVGLKMNVFSLDMAFLLPATRGVRSPLANTLRFTLLFDMAALYATDKD